MCNIKPGEVLAFGKLPEMMQLTEGWSIPGEVNQVPLLPDSTTPLDVPSSYEDMGFLHVTQVPDGLELLTVSKLSAALAIPIGENRAVVEPNYVLPFGGPATSTPAAFSPAMQTVIDELKKLISPRADPYRIAVLDSGISVADMIPAPPLRCFDYMAPKPVEVPHGAVTDLQNHGTLVCRIVSDVMDGQAEILFGRIAIGRADVTVLSLSLAHAHMVAMTRPDVINLSVAPRDTVVLCPNCNAVVPSVGWHSMILPRVFQVAGHTTWTVLAAGNTGRPSVGQHYLAECDQMAIATAMGTDQVLASYSGYTTNPYIITLLGFGGDDKTKPGGQGVLNSGAHVCGTSFAAPLVSCALASSLNQNCGLQGAVNKQYEMAVAQDAARLIRQAHLPL